MLDVESWDRIARYALGECTAAEAVATRAWIEADPERQALADELIRIADAGPTAIWQARDAWRRFSAAPLIPIAPTSRPAPRPLLQHIPGRAARTRRWLGAAAAAVLLVGASTIVWQLEQRTDDAVVAPEPLRTITTRPRQTAEVYLSDGTHVVLGAASSLRFPSRFGTARDVHLEGEAYFDVAAESKGRFAVHTAHAVTRDIGTRFSVRAYPGSAATEVVVAEGVVTLKPVADSGASRPVTDSLILAEADLGRLDTSGALTVVRAVDMDAYLGWMHGRLVFADAPLREVLPRLGHWYDLDLRLGDPALAGERLSAILEIESPDEALTLLAAALDVRIERRDRTVVLHPNRRAR